MDRLTSRPPAISLDHDDHRRRRRGHVPASPPAAAPAPPWAAQEERTGDSESGDAAAVSSSLITADGSSVAGDDDDDAESCSGGGGGDEGNGRGYGRKNGDGQYVGGGEEDVESAVDEKVLVPVPWWCWAAGKQKPMPAGKAKATDDARRAPPAAAVEDAGGHTAESNRLFWEACIAHGY